MKKFNNDPILNMVIMFLLDEDIMTQRVRTRIVESLTRNCILTSTYALQVEEVQDIRCKTHGPEAVKKSGWYIKLTGTRCSVNFFVNNDMEICRKPRKDQVEVAYTYSFYNNMKFDEGFWRRYFPEG